MLQGSFEDLRIDGGVIVNDVGAQTKLASHGRPLQVGDEMELNDNRVVVVGICKVSRTFQSQPVVYMTYRREPQTLSLPNENCSLSSLPAPFLGTTPNKCVVLSPVSLAFLPTLQTR